VERLDRALGRLLLRTWAVLAFLAAMGSAAFGIVVLRNGQLPGVVLLLLAALFAWLGLRAWRDRATLGEALSRDFTPGQSARDRKSRRDTDA
jgi:threonine/homoserine/homoserine lactone efflux protein